MELHAPTHRLLCHLSSNGDVPFFSFFLNFELSLGLSIIFGYHNVISRNYGWLRSSVWREFQLFVMLIPSHGFASFHIDMSNYGLLFAFQKKKILIQIIYRIKIG